MGGRLPSESSFGFLRSPHHLLFRPFLLSILRKCSCSTQTVLLFKIKICIVIMALFILSQIEFNAVRSGAVNNKLNMREATTS